MATQPPGEEQVIDPPEGDLQLNPDDSQSPPSPAENGEIEGEEVVFSDEPAEPGERDNGLVKHLREEIRKRDALLASRPDPAEQPIEVGDEPQLEAFNWDEVEWKKEWLGWNERKTRAEQQKAKVGDADQQYQQEWQRDHQSYAAKRVNALTRFPDYEDAEATALAVLAPSQQVTIVQAADDPALLLLALGKHPAKLAEIAAITNPIKLAKAITQLEGKLTVTAKRKPPNPEEIATGTGSINHSGADKTLEKLEKEAERTGNRTELIAYRKKLKQQDG